MKQKDIALIILIIGLSGALSFFISSRFTVSPEDKQQKVQVVDRIDPAFTTPDSANFNNDSIDLTQLITISPNTNTEPFTAQ